MNTANTDHFEGKNAYEHVLQKKSEQANEVHAEELPGHWGALLDATRDCAVLLILLSMLTVVLGFSPKQTLIVLIASTIAWTVWKTIRASWFSWSLLERLHRVLEEERFEIENHREQEKEELTALYASKGLQGELLEDVIHVLMADDERLLKVMMEEEMGLNLEHYEHPLKIGSGAAAGALITGVFISLSFWVFSIWGLLACALVLKSAAGVLMAKMQKNNLLNALIWNIGTSIVIIGFSYFLTKWIHTLILGI